MARSCASARRTGSSPIRLRPNYRKADVTPRQKAMLDFAMKVSRESEVVGEPDFAVLHAHGFTEEDAWDIGAIAAFFALSNRMANLIGLRPNEELYAMGRGEAP